jgi:hypothetical protein
MLLCLTAVPASATTILYVDDAAPGPVHDGSTWGTAFTTIQPALDIAPAGSEVWVRGGLYSVSLVVTRPGITLLQKEQDYSVTLSAADPLLPIVNIAATATGFTLGGFNLTGAGTRGAIRCDATGVAITGCRILNNGVAGGDAGGIYCRAGSSATISHCEIGGNKARNGGGILCLNATTSIINNVIRDNAASYTATGNEGTDGFSVEGGGVAVFGGTAVIRDNEIHHNTATVTVTMPMAGIIYSAGGGLAVDGASATVVNNTVAYNTCSHNRENPNGSAYGGVFFYGSGTFGNNIVAFNTAFVNGSPSGYGSGYIVPRWWTSDTLTSHNNLFWGNTPDDSAQWTVSGGNFTGDPKFVSGGVSPYDYRLSLGSSAIDAGDDSYVLPGEIDQRGNPRLIGLHVDCGAYEYPEAVVQPVLRTYVRADGSDAADGTTWATAKATPNAGISAVSPGGEVWVAQGVYTGKVYFRTKVSLLGGFAVGDTDKSARNPATRTTVLDGGQSSPVVTIPDTASLVTVDGFTIRNGKIGWGQSPYGAGIYCLGQSAVISNNIISGNVIDFGEDNPEAYGAGVYVLGGSVAVRNNVFRANSIHLVQWMTFPQFGNIVITQGGALYLRNTSAQVVGNLFDSNYLRSVAEGAAASQKEALGAAIFASGTWGSITNNTIVSNTVTDSMSFSHPGAQGGAVYLESVGSSLVFGNNLIVQNSSGVMGLTANPPLSNNDVWGNAGGNYGLPDPTGTGGSISADPLFVDSIHANYRLAAGSPAVNTGSNAIAWPVTDLDGKPRIIGGTIDMGAYERGPATAITMGDVASALRIAAGLATATGADMDRLDTAPTPPRTIDVLDAVILAHAF